MSGTQGYKCPCCGGSIEFNSRSQNMKCPYCDTEFDLDTLEQFAQEHLEEDTDPQWEAGNVNYKDEELGDEGGSLVSYVCESCGGEIMADQSMAASSCPYCGNSVIIMKKLSGGLRPDLVIPFKLDKKQICHNTFSPILFCNIVPHLGCLSMNILLTKNSYTANHFIIQCNRKCKCFIFVC